VFPKFPNFNKLTVESISLISSQLLLAQRRISELALANLFLWEEFDQPQYTFINDNLCLLISPPNEKPYFLEPLTQNDLLKTVDTCLQHCGKISRASGYLICHVPRRKYRLSPLRSEFDYLYLTKDLAELKGKKYDGKRNHIKRFTHRFPDYAFLRFENKFKKEALELFVRWFNARKESRYFPKLAYVAQRNALLKAFSNFEKLKLIGGLILAEKAIKGFIIGSQLNANTVSVHFLYVEPEFNGVSQTLLWKACQDSFAAFSHINLEQDLGIPGLRTAKLSYHPLKLEKKFEINPLFS